MVCGSMAQRGAFYKTSFILLLSFPVSLGISEAACSCGDRSDGWPSSPCSSCSPTCHLPLVKPRHGDSLRHCIPCACAVVTVAWEHPKPFHVLGPSQKKGKSTWQDVMMFLFSCLHMCTMDAGEAPAIHAAGSLQKMPDVFKFPSDGEN